MIWAIALGMQEQEHVHSQIRDAGSESQKWYFIFASKANLGNT